MTARWMVWLMACCALLVSTWARPVAAHEMSMAEMEVRETSAGRFTWTWSAANDKRPTEGELVPRWPAPCRQNHGRIDCGSHGLEGLLSVDGVGRRYTAAIVKIHWIDGKQSVYTLTSAHPSVALFGSAEDRRGAFEIGGTYVRLGVEHILSGVDHLLFVAGLLFLVGFRRRLLGTITAFTLAHSITLALSALGWLTLRSPPVEACIALSIVLVAGEALHERRTLTRRMPEVVSFLFGLVHGLGFAGALQEIGLPQRHLPWALLSFNVGVEVGQLFAVSCAWGLVSLPLARSWLSPARRPVLYAIGGLAAYWSFERVSAIVAASWS